MSLAVVNYALCPAVTVEDIVRQMLRKVRVEEAGDTDLLPSELLERNAYEEMTARLIADGLETLRRPDRPSTLARSPLHATCR